MIYKKCGSRGNAEPARAAVDSLRQYCTILAVSALRIMRYCPYIMPRKDSATDKAMTNRISFMVLTFFFLNSQ